MRRYIPTLVPSCANGCGTPVGPRRVLCTQCSAIAHCGEPVAWAASTVKSFSPAQTLRVPAYIAPRKVR